MFYVFKATGKVTLGDVADFVRHHASQFAFRFGGQNQSGVQADVAAGCSKGIDALVVKGQNGVGLGGAGGLIDQSIPKSLKIIVDFRVFDQR